uniref:Uncharacterized protein n=1 Tax=Candidatus Kentrum sp. UNK TaxID=2126344 RepID=A0A451ARE0_9GAMM|nr:MAG: hypothetical protein BECKUNK1418G_GA0071005_100537 [Candidatus Kentron sp. UNK]VFK68616.1 MAG: hypothetical protein BECKUNK1418H_GA0071006_100437 [Candidatus Kentron sp. UNK]
MQSETDLCNRALLLLGDKRIGSLAEDSNRAMLCAQYYAPTRDALLETHPWNFATRRDRLAREATEPAFEFRYAYALPAAPWCLRARAVYDYDDPWQVEGRRLLCNAATCRIRYTARITDTSLFPPLFSEALANLLAHRIAYALTGSQNARAERDFEKSLSEAMGAEAREGTPDTLNYPDIWDAE